MLTGVMTALRRAIIEGALYARVLLFETIEFAQKCLLRSASLLAFNASLIMGLAGCLQVFTASLFENGLKVFGLNPVTRMQGALRQFLLTWCRSRLRGWT